jgi:glucose-1-phosphate adenylyltransferase
MRIRVLGIVLAGGKGTRLFPLTKERAKPAVPFGGKYRIIDFVLSNFINSGIYSVYVLTQFRSQSLLQHLAEGWQAGSLLKSQFVIPVPAQMRSPDETWYQGTADAIYQNINLVEQSDPDVVAIFGGDHIYRMNITSMIEYHIAKKADVTVAAIPAPRGMASEFGVIEATEDGRIQDFHEKNPNAPPMPGDPSRVFASMGNYVFSTRTLLKLLHDDAAEEASQHDFGHNILPKLAGKAEIYAYDFQTNRIPGEPPDAEPYWRDVGTIDAYFDANMDLRSCAVPAIPTRPPNLLSTTKTAAARPSTASFPADASSPAASCAIPFWDATFGYIPARWWRIASLWIAATLAAARSSAAPSSTRTSIFRRIPPWATTWRPTRRGIS